MFLQSTALLGLASGSPSLLSLKLHGLTTRDAVSVTPLCQLKRLQSLGMISTFRFCSFLSPLQFSFFVPVNCLFGTSVSPSAVCLLYFACRLALAAWSLPARHKPHPRNRLEPWLDATCVRLFAESWRTSPGSTRAWIVSVHYSRVAAF